MRVLFVAEAAAEARDAKRWYEAQLSGLGLAFARALEAAVDSAKRNPLAFPAVDSGCRRLLLRRFPYSLVYRADETTLLVVAVFHHKRKPAPASKRIGR